MTLQRRLEAKAWYIFGVPCSVHNVRFRVVDFDAVLLSHMICKSVAVQMLLTLSPSPDSL